MFALLVLPAVSAPAQVGENRGGLNNQLMMFTPNEGQWADSVLFRATAGGTTMWFGRDGAYYTFTRSTDLNTVRVSTSVDRDAASNSPFETLVIKASFLGMNPAAVVSGTEQLAGHCNYYLGNDPTRWRRDIPMFGSILYRDIYPGIDLKYYGSGRQMEYDFMADPGADLGAIRIAYEGAESVEVTSSGQLLVRTKWGEVTEQAPAVYQEIDGEKREVSASYVQVSSSTFGFQLGPEYNPAFCVVIDPKLTYSSYFGGNGDESAGSINADDSGYVYLTGATASADFPHVNAIDSTLGGTWDVTVTKFTPDLQTIVYSTYFGGAADEAYCAGALDSAGNVFVAGDTRSSDFPRKNAYDGTYKGAGQLDAWLAKFDRSGALVFSTFFGGTGNDENLRVTVDRLGCPYIGGTTRSTNLPLSNPYAGTLSGYNDLFVAKFSPDGQTLLFSTYLGGTGLYNENLHGVAVDTAGCLYVTGHTSSPTYPTTAGAYDRSYRGNYDCYVTKIAANGGSLIYSTFVGGSQYDGGHAIAVDLSGHAYVAGGTSSADFPTAHAFDSVFSGTLVSGSWGDGFIFKLSQAGDSLEYSTFMGGSTNDVLGPIAVDGYGRAICTGQSQATDYPTKYAYQSTNSGGWDGVLVILSGNGSKLDYGTYLGGTGGDYPWPVSVDRQGTIYMAGSTESGDFPTLNPTQEARHGTTDMFITKFI